MMYSNLGLSFCETLPLRGNFDLCQLGLKLLMLYLRSQIQNKNRWRFALQNCKTLIASSKTVGNPLPYTIANYDASDVNITQTGPIPTVQINHGKFWVSCRTIALFCTTYSTFHSHTKIGTYLENVTQQWTRGGCWFLTKNRVCCKKSRLCIYTTLNTYLCTCKVHWHWIKGTNVLYILLFRQWEN